MTQFLSNCSSFDPLIKNPLPFLAPATFCLTEPRTLVSVRVELFIFSRQFSES